MAKLTAGLAAGALAWGLTGALAASPAEAATVVVHCPTDDLQTAISNAPTGSTIDVSGTCTGNFIIDRNLTLQGGATLDDKNSGTVLTVNSGVITTLGFLTIQHGKDSSGAGIHDEGTVTLNSSRVLNNAGTEFGFGGGIFIQSDGSMTVNSSSISNNTGTNGAGVFNFGTMTVNSSSLSNNTAADVGGGIFNAGTVTVNSSSISKNTAASAGGGIITDAGSTTVNSTSLSNNSADEGGGIYDVGTTTVKSSLLSNNTAFRGGGITIDSGTITLKSSSVFNNTAADGGGGIFSFGGTVSLMASLVLGNTPDNCAPPHSVQGCSG